MTTEIAKKPVEGISFASAKNAYGATRAQIELLKLMNQCVKEKRILPMEDIEYIYLLWIKCDGDKRRKITITNYWDTENHKYCEKTFTRFNYFQLKWSGTWVRERCQQWLKLNIGSMVLKNMLVAVPVFEIEEDANKD